MNGKSQRSRNGESMFIDFNNKSPFSKLRFDVQSLEGPLGTGGGATRVERDGLRFGLPADPLLDEALKRTPAAPSGYANRLHQLVDELAEDTAA